MPQYYPIIKQMYILRKFCTMSRPPNPPPPPHNPL